MRTILLIILLAVGCELAGAQTIRRVNNNPDAVGLNVYTTPQAAHDAAVANDIIIVEPSLVAYGNLTLTKPLKIYGNGYYLNSNTELRVDQRPSSLGTITFNVGSSGSYIAGMSVGTVNIRMSSNITVTRCSLSYISIDTSNAAGSLRANISDVVISGNHVAGLSLSTGGFTISNVSVSNNIINSITNASNEMQGWIVRNNTFYHGYCCGAPTIHLYNSIFENNILSTPTSDWTYNLVFTNVSYSYNVSHTTSFATVNGNQNSIDTTLEFVPPAGLSPDEVYQLKNASVLKTAGSAGSEVGAFGGPTPYVISGIPPIPSITNMINTATGSDAVELQVTISVKSNN